MESREGYSQAQEGKEDAFLNWVRPYIEKSGQFAFQNGISPTGIEAFQVAVLQQLFNKLPDIAEEQAALELYRIAVANLPMHQLDKNAEAPSAIIRFEEDLEIHEAIQQAGGVSRMMFTLFHFHGLSVEAISTLFREGEDEVHLQLKNATVLLKGILELSSDEMIDKRLALLEKSYSRFVPQINEGNILQQAAEATDRTQGNAKPRMKKGVAALLAAAGLFLAGVIGVSFALNDPNQETTAASDDGGEAGEIVTDKMVQEWVAEYTEIRESSPARLGMEQDVYEELEYVKEADEMMKIAFSDETLNEVRDDPKKMQQIVDKLLRQIETPLGMEQSLYKSPLLEEDSSAFLESYALKTKELMGLANDVLNRHQEELAEAARSGELASENLLAERKEYSEEVESLISSIDEQMLTVFVHPTEERFLVRRNIEALHGHPSLMGNDGFGNTYLYALASEPYYDESGLMMPVEVLAYHLNTMEMLLTEKDAESAIFKEYRNYLQNSFWMVLKGTEDDPVFDAAGVVHEHYQKAWKSLVHYSTETMIYTMLPIVEEMEASNWTASAHYDQLAYPDILANLDLKRSKKLEELLPHADMEIDNEMVEMHNFDYSRVAALYSEFSATHDPSAMKDVSALDIFFLYYYANSLEDPETMWHLLNDDDLKPELDVYLAEWQQLPDIKEELQFVEVVEEMAQRNGRNIELPLQYSSHSMDMIYSQAPVMVTADHVWLLKNQISENYVSREEKAVLFKQAEELYAALETEASGQILKEAKPGVVGAAYLLAAEKKDFEAMKKLTAQSESDTDDGEFEIQANERIYPVLSEEKDYSFSSEYYQTIEGQVQGTFYATETDDDGQTFSQEGFGMTKTPEGWRMTDIYFY